MGRIQTRNTDFPPCSFVEGCGMGAGWEFLLSMVMEGGWRRRGGQGMMEEGWWVVDEGGGWSRIHV